MLACGLGTFGLEIAGRSHYHSDLETSGRPAPTLQLVETYSD